jgi:general secretion pathway protein K
MVTTETKMFSIYADGIVPGYRRTTRVRIHAVVDFRHAPPPGATAAGIPAAASGSGASAFPAMPTTPTAPAGTVGSFGAGAGSSTSNADAILGALAPNPGGTVVYYRIE